MTNFSNSMFSFLIGQLQILASALQEIDRDILSEKRESGMGLKKKKRFGFSSIESIVLSKSHMHDCAW